MVTLHVAGQPFCNMSKEEALGTMMKHARDGTLEIKQSRVMGMIGATVGRNHLSNCDDGPLEFLGRSIGRSVGRSVGRLDSRSDHR